jgi:hypothetical protein
VRRRFAVLAAGTLVTTACLGLAVGPQARSDILGPSSTFTATAEGDGLNVEIDYPGALPIVNSVSASPWGSSASLDSLGTSAAAAGGPYSPLVYSLPGTINGVGSPLPPIPTPPGEVSSSYPTTPTQSSSTGPYSLSATSSSTDSKGSVTVGNTVPGGPSAPVFSTSETSVSGDGTATATATAGFDALNLAGTVDLGNVSSLATLTEAPSGRPAYRGTTNLGTFTLSGTTFGLNGSGVGVGSTSIPEPLTPAVLPVLNTALASAGIKIAYLPIVYIYTDGTSSTGGSPDPSKTLRAVDSGGLSVTFSHPIPGQGQPTVILTLGRVYVSALDTAAPALTIPASAGPASLGPSGPGADMTDQGASLGSSVPNAAGAETSSAPSIPSIGQGSPPGGSGSGAAPTAAGGVSSRPAQARLGAALPATAALGHSAELFYLILVSQLLRFLAVRLSFAGVRRARS